MFSRKRTVTRETPVFWEHNLSVNIHPVKRSILFQEEGVAIVTELHKKLDPGAAAKLKMVLKELHMDARFLNYCYCTHIKMKELVKIPLEDIRKRVKSSTASLRG